MPFPLDDKELTALQPRLLTFIRARIRDRADADDVLQDVTLRMHQHRGELRRTEAQQAWAFRIARNAVTDYHRRRERPVALELPVEVPQDEPPPQTDETITSCIRQNIERLPAPYREALLLADVEGLKQKDIATRLGLSLPGAKSRVQRGRQQLRQVVQEGCRLEFDAYGGVVTQECRNDTCDCCSGRGT